MSVGVGECVFLYMLHALGVPKYAFHQQSEDILGSKDVLAGLHKGSVRGLRLGFEVKVRNGFRLGGL